MNDPANSADLRLAQKRSAAEHAVRRYVESGMTLGLGTGSTASFAVRYIAELLRTGALKNIIAFATSRATWDEAVRLNIPMMSEDLRTSLDLAIDGADEVDSGLNLIKGGGGALLREKLVAQGTAREVIVVDESKMSPLLGTHHALPVEVLPFGWRSAARYLQALGARWVVRCAANGQEYRTDQGNMILDCDFGPIESPAQLADQLNGRAGILEHGLFVGLAHVVVVSGLSGIRELAPP